MKSGVNAIKEKDFSVRFVETKSDEINELITVFNEMLQKLQEESVRTEQQAYFLQNIIESSPVGIVILDYDGHLTQANHEARQLLEIERDYIGVELNDVNHSLVPHLQKLPIAESKVIQLDPVQKFRCHAQEIIHQGFKRKFIVIDELSSELLKTEKQAYGKVIRMMAHEVNNSMGAINSILQTVVDFGIDPDNPDEMIESLEIAKERNDNLAKFVKNFAKVIRLPPPQKTSVDLVELADHCMKIMQPLAQEHSIDLHIQNSAATLAIDIDNSQIQQVFINIIKNAIESIGQNGEVIVELKANPPQVSIKDNGPGITNKQAENLFTPFYSSKPAGQGIGLMLIRDILINHNAKFSLKTMQESGWTEFDISFPT